MVTPARSGSRVPDRRDRAQLLLVGAITLALILLGLVVIFNTVLYTDTKSGTASIDDAREAQSFNQQVKNDSVDIANWIEKDAGKLSSGDLGNMVEENVSRYSEAMAAAHVDRGPIFVNVTVESITTSGGSVDSLEVRVVYETDKIRYENVWELDP